jgi:nucleoid DNA-binding protein
MTVTKKDISKALQEKVYLNSNESDEFLEFFLNTLKLCLKNGAIKLPKFGTFHYIRTAKRIGRNPKTLKSYTIDGMYKPKFIASKKLKETLN